MFSSLMTFLKIKKPKVVGEPLRLSHEELSTYFSKMIEIVNKAGAENWPLEKFGAAVGDVLHKMVRAGAKKKDQK